MDCGDGLGMFLVIKSTYIIVIRGERACVWGYIYLDVHGEDDHDNKLILSSVDCFNHYHNCY